MYRLNMSPLPIVIKFALRTYNRKVGLRFCLSVLINLSFIAVRAYRSVHWMATSYFVAGRKPHVSFVLTFVSHLPSRTIGLKIGLVSLRIQRFHFICGSHFCTINPNSKDLKKVDCVLAYHAFTPCAHRVCRSQLLEHTIRYAVTI